VRKGSWLTLFLDEAVASGQGDKPFDVVEVMGRIPAHAWPPGVSAADYNLGGVGISDESGFEKTFMGQIAAQRRLKL